MLTRICNADGDQAEVCPERTDLAGVLVENAPEDCVLNSCPEGTALAGVVLNFTQFNTDATGPDGMPDRIPDICTINGLEKCPPGTPQSGHFVMGDGDLSTTVPDDPMLTRICNADGDQAEVCPERTDLAGVLVENAPEDCVLNSCPEGTALAGVVLNFTQFNTDDTGPDGMPDRIPDICTINGLEKCPPGTPQSGHFVMGDGDLSTNVPDDPMLTRICNADGDQAEVCPERTDLAGVLVENAPEDCVLNSCPEGTALAGVVLNFTQFNTDDDGSRRYARYDT